MYKIEYDVKQLTKNLTAAEKRHVPEALVGALNGTVFQIRDRWKTRIDQVFDRPTPITRNAVLYSLAGKKNIFTRAGGAQVYIRDEAHKGTPPRDYLLPQEHGGERQQKPFERLLDRFNPRSRKFYLPGRGLDLNAFGNVPAGVVSKILSQLQARRDVFQNETKASRARRLRRQQRRGGGGSYFVLAQRHGKLQPGVIYERIADLAISDAGNARATSSVRVAFWGINRAPSYRPRFNAIAFAHAIAAARLERNFRLELQRAVSRSL